MPGYEYEEQRWGRFGSDFVIRVSEHPMKSGKVTRICEVRFTGDARDLTDEALSSIVTTFEKERERLIELGGHVARNPDAIFPVAVGVGPISKNQNNCQVISYLQSGPDLNDENAPPFFTSGSGEQAVFAGCAGPSLLKLRSSDLTIE